MPSRNRRRTANPVADMHVLIIYTAVIRRAAVFADVFHLHTDVDNFAATLNCVLSENENENRTTEQQK